MALLIHILENQTQQRYNAAALQDNTDTVCETVLIVPGTYVHLFHLNTPALSDYELKQAVPNMLEESLSENIEALHFSIGSPNAEGERAIAVVKKYFWDQWVKEADTNGLSVEVVIPDYLCIPYYKQDWTLYYDDKTVLVRTSRDQGFSVERSIIETLLALRFQESLIKPTQLHLIKSSVDTPDLKLSIEVPVVASVQSFPSFLDATALLNAPPFNMLTEKRSNKFTRRVRSYWQWCGLSAIAFVSLLLLGQAILCVDLAIQASEIDHRVAALYQQLSPQSGPLTNTEAQIKPLLMKYQRNANLFIELLGRITPVLSRFPTLELSRLSYTGHQVTLVLSSTDMNALNQFNQTLAHLGLTLSQHQTRAQGRITETLSIGGD